jgi:hypothetical protein
MMRKPLAAWLLLSLAGLGAILMLALHRPDPAAPSLPRGPVLGPYTHENLAVYLIGGAGDSELELLTLEEAITQSKVLVHETGDVNELAIENLSDQAVFVQADEIVKGGKQDRVLAVDLVLPPRSGKVPIASFCVERGRWSRRGAEDPASFQGGVILALPSKELKLASRGRRSQQEVWANVRKFQDKVVVAAPPNAESPTSLELTLESEALLKETEAYIQALRDAPRRRPDAAGFAFAINGALDSADTYPSRELFLKMWPKMLRAAAMEAVAAKPASTSAQPAPEPSAVEETMRAAESAPAQRKAVNRDVTLETRESGEHLWSESTYGDKVFHRNCIKK